MCKLRLIRLIRFRFFWLSENHELHGREINFKDLALFSVTKLTDKDLEKIQETTLSDMEKVERALIEFNKKNNSNLTLGEFLVKRLSIN